MTSARPFFFFFLALDCRPTMEDRGFIGDSTDPLPSAARKKFLHQMDCRDQTSPAWNMQLPSKGCLPDQLLWIRINQAFQGTNLTISRGPGSHAYAYLRVRHHVIQPIREARQAVGAFAVLVPKPFEPSWGRETAKTGSNFN